MTRATWLIGTVLVLSWSGLAMAQEAVVSDGQAGQPVVTSDADTGAAPPPHPTQAEVAPAPPTTGPTAGAPLDEQTRRAFERCQPSLLAIEQQEFLALPPNFRNEWLARNCNDDYAFRKCSPHLSSRQIEDFQSQPLANRRDWLRRYCGQTLAPPKSGEAEIETPDQAQARQMQEYDLCKPRLTTELRLEFLETVPPWRDAWLEYNCRNPATAAQKPKPKKSDDYGWPMSRVAAHATFWPGAIAFAAGMIAGSILDWDMDKKEYFLPTTCIGSVLVVVGIGSAISYGVWKGEQREKQVALVPGVAQESLSLNVVLTY